jgi:hypothetical protein
MRRERKKRKRLGEAASEMSEVKLGRRERPTERETDDSNAIQNRRERTRESYRE